MHTITREQLKEKLNRNGPVLVEALSPEEFQKFHLPGAINVPLDEKFDEHIRAAVPDKDREVVVYCLNKQCTASPKAAQRMEQLGYHNVYDYEEGKMDWKEARLPVETA